MLPSQRALGLDRAGKSVTSDGDQSECGLVRAPLVVVEKRPVQVAANVYAVVDGAAEPGKGIAGVFDALGIVSGSDPVLRHKYRNARHPGGGMPDGRLESSPAATSRNWSSRVCRHLPARSSAPPVAWTARLVTGIGGRRSHLGGDLSAGRVAGQHDPLRAGVEPAATARSTVAVMDGLQLEWLLDPASVDMAADLTADFRSPATERPGRQR